MKNILFIAPPAGGKGTYSDLLVENFGYIHISTGDLLRSIDKNSELGMKVHNLISKGNYVNDEIVLNLLKEKLSSIKDKPFVLDGCPRNINQAQRLESILDELKLSLDFVVELDVPYEIGLKRAVGRLGCPNCNTIYNKFFKPSKVENICDKCESALISRSDDTEETYKTRYDIYETSSKPLIDFYKDKNKYIKIDGVNNTYETLLSVINND